MRRALTAVALYLLSAAGFVHAAEPNADDATWRVGYRGAGGSATCVWSDGSTAVLVTCNHVLAPKVGNRSPLAAYPLDVTLTSADGTLRVAHATAVGGCDKADLAVIVCEADLDFAPLAPADAAPGAWVWHRGFGSVRERRTREAGLGGRATGVGQVLAASPHYPAEAAYRYASTASSIPGDSGTGIIDPAGCFVATNCGRFEKPYTSPARGTPVSEVRKVLERVVPRHYPAIAAATPTALPAGAVTEQTVRDAAGEYRRLVVTPKP